MSIVFFEFTDDVEPETLDATMASLKELASPPGVQYLFAGATFRYQEPQEHFPHLLHCSLESLYLFNQFLNHLRYTSAVLDVLKLGMVRNYVAAAFRFDGVHDHPLPGQSVTLTICDARSLVEFTRGGRIRFRGDQGVEHALRLLGCFRALPGLCPEVDTKCEMVIDPSQGYQVASVSCASNCHAYDVSAYPDYLDLLRSYDYATIEVTFEQRTRAWRMICQDYVVPVPHPPPTRKRLGFPDYMWIASALAVAAASASIFLLQR